MKKIIIASAVVLACATSALAAPTEQQIKTQEKLKQSLGAAKKPVANPREAKMEKAAGQESEFAKKNAGATGVSGRGATKNIQQTRPIGK